jgi:hypothetical protein
MAIAKRGALLAGSIILACTGSVAAKAEGLVGQPAPLSPEMVAGIGNKNECISPDRMLVQLHAEEGVDGGRTLALVGGANQSFADAWRGLAGRKTEEVSLVLAHGYRHHLGETVKVIEFDKAGCAFTETDLRGADWNLIFGSLSRGPAIAT